jgi:hypothetical protein
MFRTLATGWELMGAATNCQMGNFKPHTENIDECFDYVFASIKYTTVSGEHRVLSNSKSESKKKSKNTFGFKSPKMVSLNSYVTKMTMCHKAPLP